MIYQMYPDYCVTMPVGKQRAKTATFSPPVDWDWRYFQDSKKSIPSNHWEIDFGMCPAKAIKDIGFDERYDSGFGFENVDTAYIMEKQGWKFMVDTNNRAVAFDHDEHEPHPYKKNSNSSLWLRRKGVIDLMYEEQTSNEV